MILALVLGIGAGLGLAGIVFGRRRVRATWKPRSSSCTDHARVTYRAQTASHRR